jgi:hypothetical protein
MTRFVKTSTARFVAQMTRFVKTSTARFVAQMQRGQRSAAGVGGSPPVLRCGCRRWGSFVAARRCASGGFTP